MKAEKIFHQKIVLKHTMRRELAIFEFVVWAIPKSKEYPEGVKYRAWLSNEGRTVFGFDNHKPKGPHLHIREREVAYVFRGIEKLKEDVGAMIRSEGYEYED